MKEIWEALEGENRVLVTDFDKTLTCGGSSLNSVVHVLGKESGFARDRNRLYESYGWCRDPSPDRRLEARSAAEEWWRAQLELFVKWDVPAEVLRETANRLPPREEFICLLKKCEKYKKIVWIVSSGLENVIQYWLENQKLSKKNINIVANRLIYEEGHPRGYGPLITDWNKKERFSKLWETEKGYFPIFLGDRQGDLNLVEPGISFLVENKKEAGRQQT